MIKEEINRVYTWFDFCYIRSFDHLALKYKLHSNKAAIYFAFINKESNYLSKIDR